MAFYYQLAPPPVAYSFMPATPVVPIQQPIIVSGNNQPSREPSPVITLIPGPPPRQEVGVWRVCTVCHFKCPPYCYPAHKSQFQCHTPGCPTNATFFPVPPHLPQMRVLATELGPATATVEPATPSEPVAQPAAQQTPAAATPVKQKEPSPSSPKSNRRQCSSHHYRYGNTFTTTCCSHHCYRSSCRCTSSSGCSADSNSDSDTAGPSCRRSRRLVSRHRGTGKTRKQSTMSGSQAPPPMGKKNGWDAPNGRWRE